MPPAGALLLFLLVRARGNSWFGEGSSPRCTCVVELSPAAAAGPSQPVLELLQRQLDRCGPEHLVCPACPTCPDVQPAPAGWAVGTVALSSAAIGLLLGLVVGRLSAKLEGFQVVCDAAAVPAREPRQPSGRGEKHGGSAGGGDEGPDQGHGHGEPQPCEPGEPPASEPSSSRGAGAAGAAKPEGEPSGAGHPEDAEGGILLREEVQDEDDEDLGIIDAGDEEWLEVHDVIREHSAVTIFNHTDSTWYVSNKHPNFVRPLHGKRRYPLRLYPQRVPWAPNVGVVPEQRRPPPAMSFRQQLQRRPHSAPNPAYGRTSGQDPSSDAAVPCRDADSHVRCCSADRAVHLPASAPPSAEAPRAPLDSPSPAAPVAPAAAQSQASLPPADDGEAAPAEGPGVPGCDTLTIARDGEAPHAARRSRQPSPPLFEDRPC